MYSGKSSGFIRSSSLPIFCCSFSVSSIGYNLHILNINEISQCCILYFLEYLNCIVSFSQLTSGLCLTNQLYSKNIFMPFKFITTVSILFICLLISSFSGTNLVTSPFLIPSTLKTSNDLSISFVFIHFSFTS